mmetsp:Transcript_29394/g.82126  ORF Transcript_29394/g.82126 Transcript_29394/m.82126 type:complete len:201 (-) Transcript_29394:319-921(-)
MNAWRISAWVFITKGPCCTTGSPMGRPWSMRHVAASLPEFLTSTASDATRSTLARRSRSCSPATSSLSPSTKYSERLASFPALAGGSSNAPPGASWSIQTATSASSSHAQLLGGGRRACFPPTSPAQTVTVARPPSALTLGICSAQCMVKNGSHILFLAGRLSQIWNRCAGLGWSSCSRGNISPCTTPPPAVIHCKSPLP